jgi:hypothetical protein
MVVAPAGLEPQPAGPYLEQFSNLARCFPSLLALADEVIE